jgi:hypothetical protein
MSQVHYKFKSSRDYDSATFDGHSISVFDLKKEILLAKGLKGPDDLALTHAESGEGNIRYYYFLLSRFLSLSIIMPCNRIIKRRKEKEKPSQPQKKERYKHKDPKSTGIS